MAFSFPPSLLFYFLCVFFDISDSKFIQSSKLVSKNSFDMSENTIEKIERLVDECDTSLVRLNELRSTMKYGPEWEPVREEFTDCRVLSFSQPKNMTPVESGIYLYPKTSLFLIATLQDLEQTLEKAVSIYAGEAPNPQEDGYQSTKVSGEASAKKELWCLHDTSLGSVILLSTITELVCPPKGGLREGYYECCLEAYERGLESVVRQEKERHGTGTTEVGTGDEESGSTDPE